MIVFFPFLKKEFKALFFTHKFLIFGVLFLLIGMISPLSAKILPDVLEGMVNEGISITISEVTYIDAYVQFFKNVTSLSFIVLVVVFAGAILQEISKGTLVLLFSKGLSRTSVFIAKYLSATLLWTCTFLLGIGVQILYTYFLFGSHNFMPLLWGWLGLWFFGIFLLSLTLFGSVCAKNMYSALLFVGGFVALCFLGNMFPKLTKYNPISFISYDVYLFIHEGIPENFWLIFGILTVLIVVFCSLSIYFFQKKAC